MSSTLVKCPLVQPYTSLTPGHCLVHASCRNDSLSDLPKCHDCFLSLYQLEFSLGNRNYPRYFRARRLLEGLKGQEAATFLWVVRSLVLIVIQRYESCSKLLKLVWQQQEYNVFPVSGIQISQKHPIWKNLI